MYVEHIVNIYWMYIEYTLKFAKHGAIIESIGRKQENIDSYQEGLA